MALVRVRISAKKKSFHDRMKHRIPVAARPGVDSGMTTRRNVPQMPHPSIQAASSSERGTPAKKLRMVQITSARLKVR